MKIVEMENKHGEGTARGDEPGAIEDYRLRRKLLPGGGRRG